MGTARSFRLTYSLCRPRCGFEQRAAHRPSAIAVYASCPESAAACGRGAGIAASPRPACAQRARAVQGRCCHTGPCRNPPRARAPRRALSQLHTHTHCCACTRPALPPAASTRIRRARVTAVWHSRTPPGCVGHHAPCALQPLHWRWPVQPSPAPIPRRALRARPLTASQRVRAPRPATGCLLRGLSRRGGHWFVPAACPAASTAPPPSPRPACGRPHL